MVIPAEDSGYPVNVYSGQVNEISGGDLNQSRASSIAALRLKAREHNAMVSS